MNNPENGSNNNSKLDGIAHVQTATHMDEHTKVDPVAKKAVKLAKLNLFITIVGLGTLGYLHFSSKGSIDDSLAQSKAALKQEMAKEFASKEEIQTVNTDLAAKMESQGARISGLEVQNEQFQEEFHKTTMLSAKVNELQASIKKSAAARPLASDSSKTKSKGKPAPKTVKKGKK